MCIKRKCKQSNLKASLLASINHLFLKNLNIFNKVNAVVCPSDAMLELAQKSGVDSKKLHKISNFINIKEQNTNTSGEYFLYVGRLDKEKGVEYLINAMKNVQQGIKLHIAGDGYEKLNLEKLAKDLNLDNISFLGFLNESELANEYKNSIATVIPCNWFETFGLTILESFSFEKPVIASNIAAIPELVEDGVNGILCEPKNDLQLTNAMNKLYNDKNLALNMGINGKIKLKAFYNQNIFVDNITQIINEVIAENPLLK